MIGQEVRVSLLRYLTFPVYKRSLVLPAVADPGVLVTATLISQGLSAWAKNESWYGCGVLAPDTVVVLKILVFLELYRILLAG